MKLTWFAFFIGFLVLSAILWWISYKTKYEGFATNVPLQYREYWLKDTSMSSIIPSLKIYLSTSSDVIQNRDTNVYDVSSLKWRNFVSTTTNDSDAFLISKLTGATNEVTQKLVAIDTGIPFGFATSNFALKGPYSYMLSPNASDSGGWSLASFTSLIYTKIDTYNGENISLFKMYADYPNEVEMYLSPTAKPYIVGGNIDINLKYGTANYSRTVAPATLIQSTPVFIAFVYNNSPPSSTVNIYVGQNDTNIPQAALNTTIPISGSKVELVGNMNLNGKLYSFLYFSKALTSSEINTVESALSREYQGTGRAVYNQYQSTSSNVNILQDTINQLNNKLGTCGTSTTSNITPPSYWQLDISSLGNIKSADLKTCSAFQILNPMTGLLSSASNDQGNALFSNRPSTIPQWIQYPTNITQTTASTLFNYSGNAVIPPFITPPPSSTTPSTSSTTPSTSSTTQSTSSSSPSTSSTTSSGSSSTTSSGSSNLTYEQLRALLLQSSSNVLTPSSSTSTTPSSTTSTSITSSDSSSSIGQFFQGIKHAFQLFNL